MICCGQPMSYIDVYGVRIYRCVHRDSHEFIFKQLSTGYTSTEFDYTWDFEDPVEQ